MTNNEGNPNANEEPLAGNEFDESTYENSNQIGQEDPFSELVDDIRDSQRESDEFDDLFDQEEIPEIDPEVVWQQLESDDDKPETGSEEQTEYTVDKRDFCQSCKYFSSPPNVQCTHEDASIIELVDFSHFRVRNCPMAKAFHQTGNKE
ncbi:hypothetical protein ACLI4Q_05935 [Natrialbaceae archaeon A-CW1-1]